MQLDRKIDRGKVIIMIIIVALSAVTSYITKPIIGSNQDAINLIVSVFSILAGFLIAIMTLVGDPKSLPTGSWQRAALSKDNIRASLYRQAFLFYLYLISLSLIFISLLIKKTHPQINDYIEYLYIFFGTAALSFSFFLPGSLLKTQIQRLDDEIESRKQNQNNQN